MKWEKIVGSVLLFTGSLLLVITVSVLGFVPITGTAQKAVLFNGTNYIDFGPGDILKPKEALTLELWAWCEDWDIDAHPTIAGNTNSAGYNLQFDNGNITAWVWMGEYSIPRYSLKNLSSGWHHLAVTADSAGARLYVDGEKVNEIRNHIPNSITQPDSTVHFMIGVESQSDGQPAKSSKTYFKGAIDEVKVWNRVLSAIELRSAPETNQGLVAHYDFEDGSGEVKSTVAGGPPGVGYFNPESTKGVESRLSESNYLFFRGVNVEWINVTLFILLLLGIGLAAYRNFKEKRFRRFLLVFASLMALLGWISDYSAHYEWIVGEGITIFGRPGQAAAIYLVGLLVIHLFFFLNYRGIDWRWRPGAAAIIGLLGVFTLFVTLLGADEVQYLILVAGGIHVAGLLFLFPVEKLPNNRRLITMIAFIGSLQLIIYTIAEWGMDVPILKTPNGNLSTFLCWSILLLVIVFRFQPPPEEKKVLNLDRLQDLLSKREFDVYELLLEGCTDQEIADRLFISINTVKTHLKKIYSKLEVRNRTEAVAAVKA